MSKPVSVTFSCSIPRNVVSQVGRLVRIGVFVAATHPLAFLSVIPKGYGTFAPAVAAGLLEVVYREFFPANTEPQALQDVAKADSVPETVVDTVVAAVHNDFHTGDS